MLYPTSVPSSHMLSLLLVLTYVHLLSALPTPITSPRPSAITTGAESRASGGLMADEKRSQSGANDDTTPYEVLGACRATCVEQTLQWPPTDSQCLKDYDCLTCWQLCEKLYEDELKWRALCSERECTIGCTTACKFSFNTVAMPKSMPWEFTTAPNTLEVNPDVLHVSWETPLPQRRSAKEEPTSPGRPFIVYTLLFRDDNTPHWSRVTSTLDLITQVDGPHATFPGLRFLLFASTPVGTIARDVPPYPALADVVAAPAPTSAIPSTTSTTAAPVNPILGEPSVQIFMTVEGRLEAEVTWLQQAYQGLTYIVTWRRTSCNLDPSMPYCPLPTGELAAHIKAKDQQDMRVVLTQLTFNSQYDLFLSVEGYEHIPMPHAVFYTSACRNLDATFMTCRPDPVITPAPPTAAPDTTSTTSTTTTTSPSTTTSSARVEIQVEGLDEEMLKYSAVDADRDGGMSVQVLLLSACVSLLVVTVFLGGFCVYKRFCSRPSELDIAKVLQSYTQLPLLGNTPQGSFHSLHQAHMHNLTTQNLYSSIATPPNGQAPPAMTSFMTPPNAYLLPYGGVPGNISGRWPSMDGLAPVGCSTPSGSRLNLAPPGLLAMSGPASPAPPVETVVSMAAPTTPHAAINTRLAVPSPSAGQRARSCDRLNDAGLLSATSRFSASAGDLTSPANYRQARRQIRFDTPPEVIIDDVHKSEVAVGRHQVEVPSVADSFLPYQRVLHTVPEEQLSDVSGDELEQDPGGVQGRLLEWEYADFELPSFRERVETM